MTRSRGQTYPRWRPCRSNGQGTKRGRRPHLWRARSWAPNASPRGGSKWKGGASKTTSKKREPVLEPVPVGRGRRGLPLPPRALQSDVLWRKGSSTERTLLAAFESPRLVPNGTAAFCTGMAGAAALKDWLPALCASLPNANWLTGARPSHGFWRFLAPMAACGRCSLPHLEHDHCTPTLIMSCVL